MKFVTESKNINIQKACTIASEIINDELFWESLPEMTFDFSNNGMGGKVGKSQLKNLLQNYVTQALVKTKYFMPWSRVVGVYFGGKEFYTNPKMCPTVHHFVGNFCHELTHLVDNFVPEYIGHLDNNQKGKENSAPYFIGRLAKAWSEMCSVYGETTNGLNIKCWTDAGANDTVNTIKDIWCDGY